MWGGSSRVVALFPVKWDLTGVVASVEEVKLNKRCNGTRFTVGSSAKKTSTRFGRFG